MAGMVDPRLADFTYPQEPTPAGVVEGAMPGELKEAIRGLAVAVRAELDAIPGRGLDCRHACSSWRRALTRNGVSVEGTGGEGEDDDVYDVAFRFVPLDERSGYRESDGRVHRHYWLAVGVEGWLFDPTAHKFDGSGGVSFDRYVVDGVSLRRRLGSDQ